jgi:hypothetical protein
MKTDSEAQLFSIDDAGLVLGGISPWTLRKHIHYGNVKVTRIGRRVFLTAEELEPLLTPTYMRKFPRADGWETRGSLRLTSSFRAARRHRPSTT